MTDFNKIFHILGYKILQFLDPFEINNIYKNLDSKNKIILLQKYDECIMIKRLQLHNFEKYYPNKEFFLNNRIIKINDICKKKYENKMVDFIISFYEDFTNVTTLFIEKNNLFFKIRENTINYYIVLLIQLKKNKEQQLINIDDLNNRLKNLSKSSWFKFEKDYFRMIENN